MVWITVFNLKGNPSLGEAALGSQHREIGTQPLPHAPNGSWGKHISTYARLYVYNINMNTHIIKHDRYRYTI